MKRFSLALLLALAGTAPPLAAQEEPAGTIEDYRPLLDNSPFLSPAFKERLAKAGATGADKVVLTGYAFVDGAWLLCIEPEAGKPHQWLKVGDTVGDHTIESFDPEAQSLVLKKGSITTTIALKTP